MLSKKKKIFILVGMVALLVVTGCLNIFLNNNDGAKAGGDDLTYQSLFDTYRADRKASRDQTILYLDAIINSASSSAEAKANAEASKQAITDNMTMETTIEGIIKGAGFDDAFITCSTQNINVIIKKEVLTSEEANKILDIVVRETLKDATNVIITPIK